MKVLGCDLGGTHVRLRLSNCSRGRPPATLVERHYRSGQYSGLESVLAAFLSDHNLRAAEIGQACIAAAGPIQTFGTEQRCRLTNLPWLVDSAVLRRRLGLGNVDLINDFEAVGYGLETLQDADLLTLQAGEPLATAPRALLGAGTGLGQALLVWDHDGYRVIATEGGHVDFAPTDELQIALLEHLRARLERVSYEDVLSGPGLERIYEFLGAQPGAGDPDLPPPENEAELAAAIGRAAVAGTDPLAARAVALFLRIYGAQAGNLALTTMARGGVYVAGGIAPKLGELLAAGEFMAAFRDKGRMAQLMPRFPVHVVRNPDIGLDGASQRACRQALAQRHP